MLWTEARAGPEGGAPNKSRDPVGIAAYQRSEIGKIMTGQDCASRDTTLPPEVVIGMSPLVPLKEPFQALPACRRGGATSGCRT